MQTQLLEHLLSDRTPKLMDATGRFSVLVPMVKRAGEYHVIYEVRAAGMRRQPGEVCFPGGKIEANESPKDCALRETVEELGISPTGIKVLGEMDFIAHRANFIMHTFLAVVEEDALDCMNLNPDEVGELLVVPLRHLQEVPPLEYDYALIPKTAENFPYELLGIPRDYKWQPGGENVPVYQWQNHAIWGLTGRITRHLLQLLQSKEEEIR